MCLDDDDEYNEYDDDDDHEDAHDDVACEMCKCMELS